MIYFYVSKTMLLFYLEIGCSILFIFILSTNKKQREFVAFFSFNQ